MGKSEETEKKKQRYGGELISEIRVCRAIDKEMEKIYINKKAVKDG